MILKNLFPGLIWNIPNEKNEVFLTFDDGPDPEVTPWILDLLNRYNAKATFFCLGKNVEKYPDLFQLIKDEGHAVGNHTYSHLNGWRTKNEMYFEDIERADKLIQSNLLRPPYGRIKPSQIRFLKKKYKIVMWDVMSGDFNPRATKEICLTNIKKISRSGSIIVFHDTDRVQGNLTYTLPVIIGNFTRQGLEIRLITNYLGNL